LVWILVHFFNQVTGFNQKCGKLKNVLKIQDFKKYQYIVNQLSLIFQNFYLSKVFFL